MGTTQPLNLPLPSSPSRTPRPLSPPNSEPHPWHLPTCLSHGGAASGRARTLGPSPSCCVPNWHHRQPGRPLSARWGSAARPASSGERGQGLPPRLRPAGPGACCRPAASCSCGAARIAAHSAGSCRRSGPWRPSQDAGREDLQFQGLGKGCTCLCRLGSLGEAPPHAPGSAAPRGAGAECAEQRLRRPPPTPGRLRLEGSVTALSGTAAANGEVV